MAEKVELTAEEADALEAGISRSSAPKIWRVTVRPGPVAAVDFVNLAPPRGQAKRSSATGLMAKWTSISICRASLAEEILKSSVFSLRNSAHGLS